VRTSENPENVSELHNQNPTIMKNQPGPLIQLKPKMLSAKISASRSLLRSSLFFVAIGLGWFAVSPVAQAVVPPPDGGYPGNNTAEGTNALFSLTIGINNTAVGGSALLHDTTGGYNVGVGSQALALNTTGSFNMAIGTQALYNNTASANLAVGFRVLYFNTTGHDLTGIGAGALYKNTTGHDNTAIGSAALNHNTTGASNTATGRQALFSNTTESFNTATGFQALFSNTGDGGHYNVATGYQALFSNTIGRRNVADGSAALYSNTIGNFNTAVGDSALFTLTTVDPSNGNGNGNTAIGELALANLTTGGGNTAMGDSALVNSITGYQNIAVGYVAGQNLTTGTNNIYISNPSVDTESNTIRIGNVVGFTDTYGFPHGAHTATYIAGINGATASGGVAVYINSDGKLGTLTSSARFKTEIKPMDKSSEAILALKPVTFRYKKEVDPEATPQFGLVAEEVEKVNPDLVVRDADGKVYTVRYEAVNAMLLNEFLKEHRTVQEQETTIAQLKSTVAQQQKESQETAAQQQKEIQALTASLTEQASQIQKVSAELELQNPPAQTVVNNQ
jgi:hypothetical protein